MAEINNANINHLVYHYLKEKCPKAAKLVAEEMLLDFHHDETHACGITLQEILEFYNLHHNNNTKDVDITSFGKSSSETSLTLSSSDAHQLPKLPTLVFQHIMDFLPCKQLQTLRLLSHEINYLASEALRKQNVSVIFSSSETIEKFLGTIATRIQPFPPFSNFEFHIPEICATDSNSSCNRFIKMVRELVQSYTFHVDCESSFCQALLGKLIRNAPNLKFVKIITSEPSQDFLSCVPSLPKLMCLALVPKIRKSATVQPNIELIRQWIKKCPKLLKFKCGFLLSLNSNPCLPDLLQFDMYHLKFLGLHIEVFLKAEVQPTLENLVNCSAKIHELKISSSGHILNDYSLLSEWVNTLSGTLRKLSVTRNYNMTSIHLPICHTLEIDCILVGVDSGFDGKKISNEEFPALKTVKILCLSSYSGQLFESEVFKNVASLHISRSKNFVLKSQRFDYIFPNLKTLILESAAGPEDLAEIIRHFTKLEHLQIINFEESGVDTYDYSDVITGGILESDIKWDDENNLILKSDTIRTQYTLGRLSQLKTLLVGGQNMENALFGLFCMTALREIPRLDSLIFVYENCQQEKVARMGATNFIRYGYHTHVRVKPFYRYCEDY